MRIKTIILGIALAAAPATALAQARVACNDGTTAKAGRDACLHHGGVIKKSAEAKPATKAEARKAAKSVSDEAKSTEKTLERKGQAPK
jgi:hypothetical protein